MKTKIAKGILLSSLIGSLLLLIGGCGKKSVTPLEADTSSGTLSGGTNIEYPPAETGYSENNIPSEGTLDDTGTLTQGDDATGNLSINSPSGDQQTDEYKREHGRSSVGLSPIYFDFDQASIRVDMADRMVNNAEVIQQLPSGSSIVIEGNCDEKGTNEYNLALGERRAINAKQYLVDLGVDAHRIRTVSYGEEQPLFMALDESAWAQNRRDDFIIE
ncbi:MAG: OmpA family protein [Bacteroidetes bacterium]|nr:OmpA family protein [Bacteroidota bacterium]